MPGRRRAKFNRFPYLPAEIRLKIWEESWPEPRAFEVVNTYYSSSIKIDGGTGESKNKAKRKKQAFYNEYLVLRPDCRLKYWLGNRELEQFDDNPKRKALEKCRDPVALYVCRESRDHTMQHFVYLKHEHLGGVWFSPSRDVMCLTEDVGKFDLEKVAKLDDSGTDVITNVCVQTKLREQVAQGLKAFPGIRIVTILVRYWNEDHEESEAEFEDDEDARWPPADLSDWGTKTQWTFQWMDESGDLRAEPEQKRRYGDEDEDWDEDV